MVRGNNNDFFYIHFNRHFSNYIFWFIFFPVEFNLFNLGKYIVTDVGKIIWIKKVLIKA